MHELATFVTFFTFLLITQSSLVGWFYDGHIQIKKIPTFKKFCLFTNISVHPWTTDTADSNRSRQTPSHHATQSLYSYSNGSFNFLTESGNLSFLYIHGKIWPKQYKMSSKFKLLHFSPLETRKSNYRWTNPYDA